jgi:hypothetical protein
VPSLTAGDVMGSDEMAAKKTEKPENAHCPDTDGALPAPVLTNVEFILSFPNDMPAHDVVAEAHKQGREMAASLVYVVRKRAQVAEQEAKSNTPYAPSILGRWQINVVGMSDAPHLDTAVEAFIKIDEEHGGSFQFGLVQGEIDWRPTRRRRRPAIVFTWSGRDGRTPASGRGWAVLDTDRRLRGKVFIHQGRDTSFSAERP